MVLNGDPTPGEIKPVVERAGGGGTPSNAKGDGMDGGQGSAGMDHIQGKLAAMQLGAGGVDAAGASGGQHTGHPLEAGSGADPVRTRGAPGVANPADPKASAYHPAHTAGGDMSASDLPKTHGNSNFFTFPPSAMTIDVDGTGAGGGGSGGGPGGAAALATQHARGDGISKFLANPNNGGVLDASAGGSQMFKKPGSVDGTATGSNASGTGGRTASSGGGGDGAGVSRRYGVPMGGGNSRNTTTTAANRPAVAGAAAVGFGGDDRRRGGGGGGSGGRRGGAGGGMNGVGVGAGRARVPGARAGYAGEGASPVRGAVEHSPLQVSTGSAGAGLLVASSAVRVICCADQPPTGELFDSRNVLVDFTDGILRELATCGDGSCFCTLRHKVACPLCPGPSWPRRSLARRRRFARESRWLVPRVVTCREGGEGGGRDNNSR